jgi:peptidoglycan/LPS O-acetylase OafA/YrhL
MQCDGRMNWFSTFKRVTTGGTYLPAVDGLRFLAITGVIFHHAVGYWTMRAGRTYSSMTLLDRCVADVIEFGAYGVHLFFVLSGFILALPFCKAARGGNPVDLKKYFWRRVTRLEPPFLLSTVLFFVADVLTHKYALRDGLPHLWATLTYTHELFFGRGSTINNATWTLEVEVQFYLLMPLIARVLWLTPFVRRSLLVVAIVFFSLNGDWLPLEHKRTILRFAQYFLAGILLADLRTSAALQAGTSWIGDLPGLLAVAACPIVALLHHHHTTVSAMPWLLAMVCYSALQGRAFSRLLSWGPVPLIGGMCYSLYLYHGKTLAVLVHGFFARRDWFGFFTGDVLFVCFVTYPFVIAVGAVFYLLIEKPCMAPDWPSRLRNRLAGRVSSGD